MSLFIKYKSISFKDKELITKDNIYYKIIKNKYVGYKSYFINYNGDKSYLVYILV
jgi:hypothetical protein